MQVEAAAFHDISRQLASDESKDEEISILKKQLAAANTEMSAQNARMSNIQAEHAALLSNLQNICRTAR
eukprot:1826970-Karenia_brevis.AAC.1